MLFSPNKGHSLSPEHPVPTLPVPTADGKQILKTAFVAPSPLMYNDVSLDALNRANVRLVETSSLGFIPNPIEDKFDTLKEFNEAAKLVYQKKETASSGYQK